MKEKTKMAIPPADCNINISAWILLLKKKKYWDGVNPSWYGDVIINHNDYNELVEESKLIKIKG